MIPNLPEPNEMAHELTRLLDELATYSDSAENEAGVTRLLYSPSWLRAQHYLAGRMADAGLAARFDPVGNLYGRLSGRSPDAPVVLTGSHVDTVRSAGKYDGAYGIVAGLAAVSYLKRTYGEPLRPIEVVSFAEEEGSRFPIAYWGSGNATGIYDWRQEGADLKDEDGVSLREAMLASGFGNPDLGEARRRDLGAFVELHIEQGMVLERTDKRIGIVETIVGQRRYAISLQGAANHAGTTPMMMRQDALAGAADVIVRLETLAAQWGEPLVATVGKIEASPNTPNVIAGSVEFTVDIRHADEWKLNAFCDLALSEIERIALRRKLKHKITPWLSTSPVPMSPALTRSTERICQELVLPYRKMVSGAGHDAQLLPPLCKTAMIFVPSKAGVSHSPNEYTDPALLADGVRVLTSMLYELAYEEQTI
ncbi:Zn-dependent hydrolase [Cohnella sp. AR92]|uniref:Zn-dependent hydrolase n=1 Tax=Cohnella sp. AR92 TaxID=648716 RepID=UPI000F8DED80|nr:Zn-dependent hydrolase [Cohnella sp. AR92]RUS46402.1 Zn-dependent hydrolase [Cohnella sp. AR92]